MRKNYADQAWMRRALRGVREYHATHGTWPTFGALALLLGWTGGPDTTRRNLGRLTRPGWLEVSATMPKRVRLTAAGGVRLAQEREA